MPGPPQLTCPPAINADVVDALLTPVQFPVPVAIAGSPPVATTCSVASGAVFTVGTTTVTCTATDALARTAQCAFSVTVNVVPKLQGTRIVAFGDSITAGEVSEPFSAQATYLDTANSYPSVLAGLLTTRYRAQQIVVINEGEPGERVVDMGEQRMQQVVLTHRPDALLVLEGVNGLGTMADAEATSEALRRGVRRAIRDGVPKVFVSTILPGAPAGTKPPSPVLVEALNANIRLWVPTEGAVLIDSYSVFRDNVMELIGRDGLHPTLEGYRKLADLFHTGLMQHFELPPPTSAAVASFGLLPLGGPRR